MTLRWIVGAIAVAACGGTPPAPAPAVAPIANRAAHVDPEPEPEPAFAIGLPMPSMSPARCAGDNLRIDDYDLNDNGILELRKVWSPGPGGHEWLVCKLNDHNQDGRFDEVIVHDQSGARIEEYADFDFDGRADVAKLADRVAGEIRLIDTDADGMIDHADPVVTPP